MQKYMKSTFIFSDTPNLMMRDDPNRKPDASPTSTATPEVAGLGDELRLVLGRLVRRVREQTRPDELSLTEMVVLARLDRDGPSTVSGLARYEGVRPQSMGATVSGLAERGLVAAAPDPADRRAMVLSLTENGRRVVLAGRAARADWLNRTIRERLTEAEQQELTAAVSLLKRLID